MALRRDVSLLILRISDAGKSHRKMIAGRLRRISPQTTRNQENGGLGTLAIRA
jgi:hypothetical protein